MEICKPGYEVGKSVAFSPGKFPALALIGGIRRIGAGNALASSKNSTSFMTASSTSS